MKPIFRKSLAALLAFSLALWPMTASATDNLWDYSATTPGDNTNIGGVSYAEAMAPGLVNDGVRMLISQLKRAVANKGSDISSGASTAICATGTSVFAHVTGTTTITGFGTAAAGCTRLIIFDGILTLTHNASSLILPGGVSITTAANDNALAVSEGAGNWRVMFYLPASGGVVGGFSSVTATSTDAGAGAGPDISANRNSASAADADLIGRFLFDGRDDASNTQLYASAECKILDSGSTSEDAECYLKSVVAGTFAARLTWGQGVQVGAAATGGDCGLGCLNADTDVRVDNISLAHGLAQVVTDTEATYTTLGTVMPYDNTIPQNTEGDEILSVAITPKSASSTLIITFTGMVTSGSAGQVVSAALFVDATAGALNATGTTSANNATPAPITLTHVVTAGSTSARTYKIRAGNSTATDAFLNGDSGSRNYGGVSIAVLKVEEILP